MASEGKTVNTGRREDSGIMVNEGGRVPHDIKGKHRAAYSVTSRGTKLFLPPPGGAGGHYGRWAFESICVFGDNGGKPYNRASPVENHTTALTRAGNTPLLPTAPPPKGEVLAALYLEMLMRPKAERRVNFPLRGKSRVAGIGVHFQRATGAVVWFAIGRSPVVKVLGREAAIIIAASAATTTLGPKGRQT